jgi:2-keto-3-deoxy-L-rhamnonate aldolase RhmA
MRNPVKRMIQQGELVVGTLVLALGSPNLMWLLAAAGFDFVYLDAEHSSFSIETLGELAIAARLPASCRVTS